MANNLLSAKKLLVVTPSNLALPEYLSLHVTTELLKQKGVQITLLSSGKPGNQYAQIAAFPEVEMITKIPPRKFVLSFRKGDSTINNVQWSQSDEELSFHISLDKGKFSPEGMNLTTEGADFDTVFFFGINDFGQVAQGFGEFPDLMKQTTNVSTNQALQIQGAKVEAFATAEAASLPEAVYTNYKNQGLTREQQGRLLAAFISATNHFRKNASAQTFLTCGEIIEQGASLEAANSLVDRAGSAGKQGENAQHKNAQGGQGGKNQGNDKPNQGEANSNQQAKAQTENVPSSETETKA